MRATSSDHGDLDERPLPLVEALPVEHVGLQVEHGGPDQHGRQDLDEGQPPVGEERLDPLEEHGEASDQQGQGCQPPAPLTEGEHRGLHHVVVAVPDRLHQVAEEYADLGPSGGPSGVVRVHGPLRRLGAAPSARRWSSRGVSSTWPRPHGPRDRSVPTVVGSGSPRPPRALVRASAARTRCGYTWSTGRRRVGSRAQRPASRAGIRHDRGCPSSQASQPPTPGPRRRQRRATRRHGSGPAPGPTPGEDPGTIPAAGLAHCPVWLPSTSSPCAT